MAFTHSLWESIRTIYARILDHPFLRGLTDGSLDEEAFRFYAVQDALYLRDFARGLAVMGAKATEDSLFLMFAKGAMGVFAVEQRLHQSFFHAWGLAPDHLERTPMAPNTLMYTSYLMRVAYERPFHEVMGAFLPCYWIYWEVGKHLKSMGSPNTLFQKWIDTYAGEEFGDSVRAVLAAMDTLAETLTEDQREAVRGRFVVTSRLEYLFWDMGFRKQTWPV